MNEIYTIKELPQKYFGGTYTIFSFDVIDGHRPLALHFGDHYGYIITICDLDKLDGYYDYDTAWFFEDTESYKLFVKFLESITLHPNGSKPTTYYDAEYAKKRFNVDLLRKRL